MMLAIPIGTAAMNRTHLGQQSPPDDRPAEDTTDFGEADDPGLESDEDLDGEQDADGGRPLHG